jgi:hypothetical protein
MCSAGGTSQVDLARRSTGWLRRLGWMLLVLATTGAGIQCARFLLCALPVPQPLFSAGEVQWATGLRFPAGSRLVSGVFTGGMTEDVDARVRIPRASVEAFVRQPAFQSLERDLDYTIATGDDGYGTGGVRVFVPLLQAGDPVVNVRYWSD